MRKSLFLVMLLFIPIVHAHLDNGSDITVHGYLVDFGYAPAFLNAGDHASFAVNILNATTLEPINNTNLWVRISSGDTVGFSGTLGVVQGNTVFAYTFPSGGNYEVAMRFANEEAVFPLTVKEHTVFQPLVIIAVLLLVVIFLQIIRRKK